MKTQNSDYFIGLDIGTDSVGYAVTDIQYKLCKFKGEPMWGVHLFEEALLNEERRSFRTSRRRLDRRQQRIKLIQELFAKEIAKIDEHFYVRIKESALYSEDTTNGVHLFDKKGFSDTEYNREYPTIHHLINELIESDKPHDVRLVYLAVSWLVAHRGHFLNEISKENIADVIDIANVYNDFVAYFNQEKPWECKDISIFGDILKKKNSSTKKYKELSMLLYGAPKAPKAEPSEEFPYDRDSILKLLCGGKVSPNKLFCKDEYSEIESFSLDKSDDELAPILSSLGDDAELILKIKALFDWAILSDVLQGETYISKSKINIYEQHKCDLANLKYIVKKYVPHKYNEMFRAQDSGKANYEAYAKGSSGKQEDFCKYTKVLLKGIAPDDADKLLFDDVMSRLEEGVFCPKQVNSDNRVIPYQVYWMELKAILDNASKYLTFLNQTEDGISVAEKILSVFEFRVPYFVGPLNKSSKFAWIVRKSEGAIYPWNFNEKVDLEASEQAFIDKMTNTCTYLPNANVLPKMSLCYERFQLLNEINAISVNGRRLSVEIKQKIFNELCMKRKKITKKAICDFLKSNNHYTSDELSMLSGIDDNIKTSLVSHMAFNNMLCSAKITEADVERIIERRTYTESKSRFAVWLEREYPNLSEGDKKYICSLKIKDFGRLSREFLCELYGTEKNSQTGEALSILDRMWNENVVLMEVLSDNYTYSEQIQAINAEYYGNKQATLDERLSEMYISNAVKRPIIRTLDIISDVVKANGKAPEKIFIEMARGGKTEEKGKRKESRYAQVLKLYEQCDEEDVRYLTEQLEQMGDAVENRLQSDKLFLYYMQLGKCMYTGETIELSQLSGKLYDIDHIYPQSKVKDDSVLNNKVLVLSTANAEKGDIYPIKVEIRKKMAGWWKFLKDNSFITEEKYKRLTRSEPFSDNEQWGFINRQLVETRQSTKVIANILSELYPETRIVYVKAGLVSEFRQEFDMLKSRDVNDLHHAKDAYLNIVVGNVYNERFTKQWYMSNRDSYNLKIKTLFNHPVKLTNGTVVWNGSEDIGRVKNVVHKKNAIHLTRYAFCRKGGFFAQQPVSKSIGLVPLKKGLPTEKYGGYNKTTASFFMLVKYSIGKKSDLMLMPVELLFADKVISDVDYASEYAKKNIGSIINKEVLSVSFPLGMRKIKIGTVFEFDGCFRAYLTGKANGGKVVSLSAFCPLIVGYEWEKYIKRLSRFVEKKKENPKMVYYELYDEVNIRKNTELYDILILKMQSAIYKKRPANPADALINGKNTFEELDIFEQSKCLMQILTVFGRINNGCDLSAIGGVSKAAVLTLSSILSNWNKNYKDIRILDMSASGLYQSKTENLLEML